MDSNPSGYAPEYDIRHLLTAVKVFDSSLPDEKKNELYKKITSLKLSQHDKHAINDEIADILTSLGGRTFYHLLLEYNISPHVYRPFQSLAHIPNAKVSSSGLLDSINFDFSLHYNPLRNALLKILSKKKSSVIMLGGSDSLEYYATALTADMDKKGLLADNNLIFLSAIKTFEEDPSHVAGLIKGAIETAKTVSNPDKNTALIGAYLITPILATSKRIIKGVTLHKISKGITKISSRLEDAFRSNDGIKGTIMFKGNGEVESALNNIHEQAENKSAMPVRAPLNVAPPILRNTHPKVVYAYLTKIMQQVKKGKNIYDILPIESIASISNSSHTLDIVRTIQQLAKYGVRTAILRDLSPPNQHSKSFRMNGGLPELKETQLIKDLKDAGAIIKKGSIIQLYTELKYGGEQLPEINLPAAVMMKKYRLRDIPRTDSPIKIKYIPDQQLFIPMLYLASEISSHIVIESLPGQALPDIYKEPITEIVKQGTKISVGFKYNGQSYVSSDGEKWIEGQKDSQPYAASKWLKDSGVDIVHNISPQEIMSTDYQPQR